MCQSFENQRADLNVRAGRRLLQFAQKLCEFQQSIPWSMLERSKRRIASGRLTRDKAPFLREALAEETRTLSVSR
jgi:hypothetical protein